MKTKNTLFALSVLLLAGLACNFIQSNTQPPPAPPPTVTPFVPQQADTPTAPPAQPSATSETQPAEPTTPTPTNTPPQPTSQPPTSAPTDTPKPESEGPLDFTTPVDEVYCGGESSNGRHNVMIVVHITGGAPPFTLRHVEDVFETSERDFHMTYERGGCGLIVHELIVESADGQSVSHDYAAPDPCCQ